MRWAHAQTVALTVALILLVYLGLATATAWTKPPWIDEALYFEPAQHLADHGYLASYVVPEHITPGINRYVYWSPPVHFIVQAGWYKLVGAKLMTQRALAILFGGIAILFQGALLWRITGQRAIALLAMALLAVDHHFIQGAADGRPDTLCLALSLGGIYSYVRWRRRHLLAATLAAHTLVVLAGLTHPNGVIAWIALVVLTLVLDRGRIFGSAKQCLTVVAVAIGPYLVGGLAWGLYILQSPGLFKAQFFAILGGRAGGSRLPWVMLEREAVDVYGAAYGLVSGAPLAARAKAIILLAYLLAALLLIAHPAIRRLRGARVIALLLLCYVIAMTVIIGNKVPTYLVHLLPWYTAALAFVVHHRGQILRNTAMAKPVRWAMLALAGLSALIAVGGSAMLIKQDRYHRVYIPAAEKVQALRDGMHPVHGCSEIGYHIGFGPHMVGNYLFVGEGSSRAPIVVIDPRVRKHLRKQDADASPKPTMDTPGRKGLPVPAPLRDMKRVFDNGVYEVYVDPALAARPGDDASGTRP